MEWDICSAPAGLDTIGELCGDRCVGVCRRHDIGSSGNVDSLLSTTFYLVVCVRIEAVSYVNLLVRHT